MSQAVIKPQYVDHIPKAVRGNVGEMLTQKDERNIREVLLVDLDLQQVGVAGSMRVLFVSGSVGGGHLGGCLGMRLLGGAGAGHGLGSVGHANRLGGLVSWGQEGNRRAQRPPSMACLELPGAGEHHRPQTNTVSPPFPISHERRSRTATWRTCREASCSASPSPW